MAIFQDADAWHQAEALRLLNLARDRLTGTQSAEPDYAQAIFHMRMAIEMTSVLVTQQTKTQRKRGGL
jgi:hypothetical protein